MKNTFYESLNISQFLLICAVFVYSCDCCPLQNATDEQILDGNRSLKDLYKEYSQGGIISLDKLKNLIAQLHHKPACLHAKIQQGENKNFGHLKEIENLEHPEEGVDRNREEDTHIQSGGGINNQLNGVDEHVHEHNHAHEHDHAHVHEHDQSHNLHQFGNDHEHNGEIFKNNLSFDSDEVIGDQSHTKPRVSADLKLKGENDGELDKISETKGCEILDSVILNAEFSKEESINPQNFLQLCPSILKSLLHPPCQISKHGSEQSTDKSKFTTSSGSDHNHDQHRHIHYHKGKSYGMTKETWIAAVLSMVLIGLIALCCIMVIPVLKRSNYYIVINHFLLALAVGSLAGDALIHLLPHAMTFEIDIGVNVHLVHALYGFTSFVGILLFLLMERIHNLIGHKHSHGHSHDNVDGDELIKEIGVISAEMNETGAQHFDKIGEKLSQHSKHSSFIYTDTTSPSEPRGCFESCPPNTTPGMEDANGNNGVDSMVCKPRVPDHNSASLAECERLVTPYDKNEQTSSGKNSLQIPPPPLVQTSPPKPMVRQDSKNFNMVLQEYHVGHHGHSHHGHSHVTGKKESLRTMILLGDGMHTFMDGMAIGAAYGTSLTGGIATAIAVLCHELPHKVGDFAILFEMGMKRNQAIKMVLVLWCLSLIGLVVGVSIGSIQKVSPWIYCFTAGIFLYLALVDLLSELSINGNESCSAASQMSLQVAGMMTGAGIMLLIAIYEHDLKQILEGTF